MRTIAKCSLLAVLVLSAAPALAQPVATKVSPVERPIAGDMGISFAFKGLAPMSVGGVSDATIGQAFGATMLNVSPPGGGDNNRTDFGLGFGIGFQHYFRTWRRIAPYVGAKLHLSYFDPSGDKNYLVQVGIGPSLGIEYFIADRVSLSMEYNFFFSVQFEGDNAAAGGRAGAPGAVGGTAVGLGTSLWMGGQMALTFYF